jgi:hypothetical protein
MLDWFLTLDREISLIWAANWNWSKALYLLSRYIPFAYVPALLHRELIISLAINVNLTCCDILLSMVLQISSALA